MRKSIVSNPRGSESGFRVQPFRLLPVLGSEPSQSGVRGFIRLARQKVAI